MQLTGKTLTCIDITRSNIFDAQIIECCDNCGRAIVNTATVLDETGKKYTIGLDCKKTLIDKPLIDALKLQDNFQTKYAIKDVKQATSEAEKFLKYCAYANIDIELSNSEITIHDNLPNKQFPQVNGNIIYMQNTGYLYKIGLKPFIENLYKTGKAKLSKY